MTEEENYVLFKPRLSCLFTHLAAWTYLGVLKHVGRDVYECSHCKTKFFYPTRKDEYPVYEK